MRLASLMIMVLVSMSLLGCRDRGSTPSSEPAPASASLAVGPEGGSLEVAGGGAIAVVRLTVPEGTLEDGEEALLTLARRDAPPDDQETLYGAAHQVGLDFTIEPATIDERVLDAMEVTLVLDPDGAPDDAQREEMLADPAGWADRFLFHSRAGAEEVSELSRCVAPRASNKHAVELHPWRTSDHIVHRLELITPNENLQLFTKAAAKWSFKHEGDVWAALRPHRTLDGDHPHLGNYRVSYFPISVSADAPEFPKADDPAWSDPTQLDDRLACVSQIIDQVATQLWTRGFTPIDTGRRFDVALWDFTAQSSTIASATYHRRSLNLRSRLVDPARYADGCIGLANAEEVFSIAHEMFHWQQEATIVDQTRPGWWGRLKGYYGRRPTTIAGPYDLADPVDDQVNLWWQEATANHFGFELVRPYSLDDWYKHGLTAFALHLEPWALQGSTLYRDERRWAYRRQHYFKYLFDREGTGEVDELVESRKLLESLATVMTAQAGPDDAPHTVDLSPAVYTVAQSLDREWFGFFREFAMLRGCASANLCPQLGGPTHPFGRQPTSFGDLYGISDDMGKYWAPYASPDDPYSFDSLPFSPLTPGYVEADEGRTQLHPAECRFDTVKPSFLSVPLNASEILAAPGAKLEIDLAIHVQYPLAGTRLDVVDDLDYSTGATHTWQVDLGPTCEATLRTEGFRWQEDPTSMRWLGAAENSDEVLEFTTTTPPAEGIPLVSLLIGNESPELPEGLPDPCRATIRLVGCPCEEMMMGQDPVGDPGDTVLFCQFEGANLVLCDDQGAYVPGLLSDEEYGACYAKFSAMASYCGLGPTPP